MGSAGGWSVWMLLCALFLLGSSRPHTVALSPSSIHPAQHISLHKASQHSAESLQELEHSLREAVQRIRLRRYLSALANEEREKRWAWTDQNDYERMAPIWGR